MNYVQKMNYKGKEVKSNFIAQLIASNPPQSLTIHTYNYCGEHLLPNPLGERIIQDIEYLELETGESVYAQHVTIFPHKSSEFPTGEDFKTAILNYLDIISFNLKTLTEDSGGDDDYYDYIPAYIEQVFQTLHLFSLTNLLNDEEINQYAESFNKSVETLNAANSEDPAMGDTPIFYTPNHRDDNRLHFIGFK